ncbi:hypothetical protein [Sulfurimonas sp.]|uniref:tetratricopeptide repeat protein n=1 Tax=Sulfurimonas sp. TaxID=2022749 RepID=UPI0025D3812C|nr:hypothetical protein [Sulfurimonas sp.]MDD5156638.1 hypothetical protein [Sulfurimonas sp.]
MSNKIVLFMLLILSVAFSGCVGKYGKDVKANQKMFNEEDIYIFAGLNSEQAKENNASSVIFNSLYEKTGRREYFIRSIKNDIEASENERAIWRIDEIIGKKINDFELVRFKIVALMNLDRLDEAKELVLKLVANSGTVDDYLLSADIYIKLKEFDTCVKYLESAYLKEHDEKLLDKISVILYVNLQRKTDAIAQLETHSRVLGCSKIICMRLASFYSNDNNIDGLLSVYLRLYKIEQHKEIGEKILQIYGYKKDFLKMMMFLEESKINDEALLQLYIQQKNYKKASLLANELYKKIGDINFLGQSAIFEYESSDDKKDKVMVKSIIEKLESVVAIKKDGLYLNYLGYVLIDYELDIKKGIQYIEEALKMEPDSIYYLDSLAWGYYKLNDCKKAGELMDRVIKDDNTNNEEIKIHLDAINKCKKGKK